MNVFSLKMDLELQLVVVELGCSRVEVNIFGFETTKNIVSESEM